MDLKSQERFAYRCLMKTNSWKAAGKHMAEMAGSQQKAKSCWSWCHNDRHLKLQFQIRKNWCNPSSKLWRKWRDEIGREISHSFPKFSKLKAWTERSTMKWKFNYVGFGSDDNSRTLSWFARKLWKQEVIQRHLQLVLPYISELAVDSESMEPIHTWRKNPQLLTEIQKFCYVSDEKKNPVSRFWYTGNVRKTGSFWFYHHLFETDIPDLILEKLKD